MGNRNEDFDSCFYIVEPGQQRHWLRFVRDRLGSGHFLREYEYRLEASEFIAIVQALRDVIAEYVDQVQGDARKIETLFAAIDAFAKRMSQ